MKTTILAAEPRNLTMLLQTAIRVITAYTEHRVPETADVELLRKHALPPESDLPVDALASEIIRRELERRKAAGTS